MSKSPTIHHTSHLVADALDLIERCAQEALAARGEFRLALSGGSTPRPVYEALAKRPLPWGKFLFTFGDERCVSPDAEQSNYLMARHALFDVAPVPGKSILRMHGEDDPSKAALAYEDELLQRGEEGTFRHDLILLGMGDDGHTASLFPETPALGVDDRLVIENYVPRLDAWRLTFTYPLINAARHVCFLVSQKDKESVLKEVLAGDSPYPCAAVQPTDGGVTWMIGQ